MCEFCNWIRDAETERNYRGNYIKKWDSGHFDLFLGNGGSWDSGELKDIKYCPMCGRKLTEGQPMFEVIYALSSYREIIRTINNLATKLKQCGIDVFEIHEGIQIKSDKFIVSAVDVWGAVASKDYRLVKYYIDKVSDKDYSSAQGKENALLRLKWLKYEFRDEVKEISEEELIKILTEGYR